MEMKLSEAEEHDVFPACRTAVRPEDGPDASTAAVAEGGLQVTSPAHWSRTGQLCGRISAALLHPSACGGCAASVRGHPLPPVTHPISVKGRTHRALSIRNTAASCCALLTRAGPDHGLVGLVPHCSGEARAAAEKHVVCDRCYTPRTHPVCPYARRADRAVFRRLRRPRRTDPLHDRPSPDPPRSTRTAPGRGACFYSAYIAKERAARETCLKVNVCIPQ